jgi:hypothetical protein
MDAPSGIVIENNFLYLLALFALFGGDEGVGVCEGG